jgi:hypothetical protein
MRLYNNGVPKDSICSDLEYIYMHLSTYICQDCGKPAKYESRGWIAQECEEHKTQDSVKKGNRSYYVTLISSDGNGKQTKRKIDCKGYWYEYIKCLELTDENFLHYVKTGEFIKTKKVKSISSRGNKTL